MLASDLSFQGKISPAQGIASFVSDWDLHHDDALENVSSLGHVLLR